MKPVSPVIPGLSIPEVVFAKDHPEYLPLPAICCTDAEGRVISRWKLSWWERLTVLWTGSVWLTLLSFRQPLTPSLLSATPPELKVE